VALVLALEPDARQAAVLKQVVIDRLGAEFVLADSKDAALAAIGQRVPDLILVTALLSPRDEADFTDHLRNLDGAEHLQTLTIPLLATGAVTPAKKKKRGLLSALTGEAERPAAPTGCLPAVFAEEVRNYLARAEELKIEASAERARSGARKKKRSAARSDKGKAAVADTPAESGTSSYWAWDEPASSSVESAATDSAEPDPSPAPGAGSSWDNPWDTAAGTPTDTGLGIAASPMAAEPAAVVEQIPPADADTLPAPPAVDAVDALLGRPAAPTAGDLLAAPPAGGDLEVDLSALLDGRDRQPAAAPEAAAVDSTDATGPAFYQVSADGLDIAALLRDDEAAPGVHRADASPVAVEPSSVAVATAELDEARAAREAADRRARQDHEAIESLRADLERMRADREAVQQSLTDAREAQQKAETAAADAAARAAADAEQRAQELAERAEKEAAAEKRAREREERQAREEVERRAEIERLAREQAERLAKEVEARLRDEAATERRLREQAEREAEAARVLETARRSEREASERQARLEAERRAEEERQRRQQAEARIEAERKAREQVEKRAREQAERLAREAEERRVAEASERKARELAERQARDAERQAREAERQAKDAERQAREAAESETRLRSQRLVREAEERRAREAAQLKAREAAERQAREEAERRAEAERAARQEAERKARLEAERRAEAERRTVTDEALRKAHQDAERRADAERKARLDAEHQARREAERRAEAERHAQVEADRLAGEAAKQAREAAKAERRAREQAEKRAAEERKAREAAERRARDESARRAAAEARAQQEEARREQQRTARPAKKAAVVRRRGRRAEPEAPIYKRGPGDDDRPLQDEWGLYDPDKCGFGALYAKLEAIEDGAPPREEAPTAGDLVAGAGAAPRRVNGRTPRPLSMWAWRDDHAAPTNGHAGRAAAAGDLGALVDGLAIAPAVAAMRYASGARIRRVTVPPAPERSTAGGSDAPVIILSRKLLKAVRQKSTGGRRLTARR
jgi:hypothetical protein